MMTPQGRPSHDPLFAKAAIQANNQQPNLLLVFTCFLLLLFIVKVYVAVNIYCLFMYIMCFHCQIIRVLLTHEYFQYLLGSHDKMCFTLI